MERWEKAEGWARCGHVWECLEIKAYYVLPSPAFTSPTSVSSNGWVLTNGGAEARGRAERNREREAGSGCVQAGLLVPGMSHMGH